ncbi:MAG: hypothetical protein WCH99_13675 [Verrucomicrobiota bacterium]
MKSALLATLVVIATSLIGCSKEQHINTTSEPNNTTPTVLETSNENPFYKDWSQFKKGSETIYELTYNQAGLKTKLPLNYKLLEIDASNAVIELNLPADTRVTFPALAGKNEPKAKNWPDPLPLFQFGYLPVVKSISGHEVIVAGGKKYNCEWGEIIVAGMKVKQWFCSEVPGRLVKSQVDGKDRGIQMEEVLSEVKTPKE